MINEYSPKKQSGIPAGLFSMKVYSIDKFIVFDNLNFL
jgi:hypothetical protein